MAMLRRYDGAQFILQPYRELLSFKKTNLLKKEIRLLARNNGEYVRLFKLGDGQVEAVFSHEGGVLLGEAIWRYFGRPEDMIYCEALPDNETAILVIVRHEKVFLDNRLNLSDLRDEFISLVTNHSHFVIYIYGNVPLSDMSEEGKFTFDKSFIKSFNELDVPLFESLPIDETLHLLPLDEAITLQQLGRKSPKMAIAIFLFLMTVIVVLWQANLSDNYVKPEKTKQLDPVQLYQSLLSGPNTRESLTVISEQIEQYYFLPGWQIVHVDFSPNKLIFKAHSLGGDPITLAVFAAQHGATMELSNDGVLLTQPISMSGRNKLYPMNKAHAVINQVVAIMMNVLPTKSINLANDIDHLALHEIYFSIDVDNVAPEVLRIIGEKLGDLPLVFKNGSLAVENGMLSGKIQFSVIGS